MTLDIFTTRGPFTPAEVAAACEVSVRFVQKCIAAETLRACRVGKLIKIPGSAARAFALSVGVEPEDLSRTEEPVRAPNVVQAPVVTQTIDRRFRTGASLKR